MHHKIRARARARARVRVRVRLRQRDVRFSVFVCRWWEDWMLTVGPDMVFVRRLRIPQYRLMVRIRAGTETDPTLQASLKSYRQ